MGTGTTGIACKIIGRNFIGSEISLSQVEYSKKRIEKL
jgi:DNA modification methylase